MGSLTTCIQKAGKALHPDDKAALIERARALRSEGKSVAEAATQAVDEQLAAVRGMLPQERAVEPKPATPGKVENFGEVLPPSRRAKAAALMAETSDADIAAKPLSEIWPLSENEAIEDKFAAAVAHAARAEVPAKPRQSYKLKRWVEQVKTVRGLAQKIVGGSVTREQFIEQSKTFRLEGFMAKVALLEAIDRAQWKRIGDVREAPDAGRYEGTGPDSKFVREPQVFVEIDGKGRWMRGSGSIADHIDAINSLLGVEAQAKRMEFEVRGSGSSYFINKKGDSEYRRLKTFTTSKEAIEYKRSNYADLVQAWESVKERDNVTERDLRSDANKDRIGPDRRQGRDITGEEFDKTFGFKGGEFGKWVSQGAGAQERQWMLNRAYDAFMDLAELVGIPPRAVSLNGTLGIAFGSRGSGWASAHFEPGNLVINLTKTRGAGALAHEWFHALDNYFARMRGGEVPMSVVKTAAGYRQHNYVTYKAEPLMVRKDGKGTPTTKADLERMRAANPSSGYLAADNWQVDPKHPQGVRPEVEERFAELVKALNAAPMTQRARMIDKGGEGYWSQIIERAARSFEAYVIGRMAEKGQTNEYLANVTPLEDFKRDPARYPYPTPAEIRPVAEAFDSLFDTIETREEGGNTLLFDLVDAGGTQPDNTPRGQEPTRTAAARAVADLAADLTRDSLRRGGRAIVLDHVTPGHYGARAREFGAVSAVAHRYFNREVVFVRFQGGKPLFNGAVWAQQPGIIYLNADAARNRPLMSVLGHELLHHLRSADPRLYHDLNKRLVPLLKGETRYRDALEKRYKDAGMELPMNWPEELNADIVGDFFMDKQFWLDMAKDRPTLFKSLGDAIIRFLDDVLQWMTNNRPFGTEQYLTDVQASREAVTQAMRAFSERQTLAPLGGGTQLSVATDTDAFRKWFGDSKVVDKDGKPLVVYHGTDAEFAEFKAGVTEALGFPDKQGFYFTAEPGAAADYGKTVMPAYLSIRNPYMAPRDDFEHTYISPARRAELEAKGHDGVIFAGDPKTGRYSEYVPFSPTQIKSATGNRGTFDPASADIRFSLTEDLAGPKPPKGDAPPPKPPKDQRRLPLRHEPGWTMPESTGFDKFTYKFQDKNIDLRRAITEIKADAKTLEDRWDAYLQEELFHGRAAKRVEDFVHDELEPLIRDMKLRQVSMEQLDEFLHARHAEEANELIAERNPDMPDGGSGMTTADAKAYLAGLDPAVKRRLEALGERVDRIIAGTRQTYVGYGLESKATVDGWAALFKHYVPLMREDKDAGMGIGQGFSIKGPESKHRTGSSTKVVDILANIALQREKAIVRGEKNRVAVSLAGLVKMNPNDEVWTFDTPPTSQTYNEATGLVETTIDPLYRSRPNVLIAKIRDSKTGQVHERAVVFNEHNERAMRMVAALKNLDAAQMEEFIGAMAKATRWFASINTQYNPVFGAVNLARDVGSSAINLTGTPLAGKRAAVLSHVPSALKGIYLDARKVRSGKHPTSDWAQLWEGFQKEGGQTGFRDLFRTSEDRAAAIQKALDPAGWMDSTLGKLFTAAGTLKVPAEQAQKGATWLFDWLSDYNLAMENAVRVSAYKVALEQGMSKQRAASLAKNLTVNFNRKGAVTQQMGAFYAFFNASTQGTARMAEVLFKMDRGRLGTLRITDAGKAIIAGGIGLGVLQAVLLAAAGYDDEEPPQFVRERNLILPIGDGKYLTWPMPLGWHVLPNVGRIATEYTLGGFKKAPKHLARVFSVFVETFNPLGGAGSLTQTLTPTPFDPLVALGMNQDWTGKPIARESRDASMPGHSLAKDTASAWAKWLSEGINAASGGTKYTAGVWSPTPDQIDYLIGQVTGGVGREVSKLSGSVSGAMAGEDVPPHKIPLVGRFYGDVNGPSAQASRFYENLRVMNEHERMLKGLADDRLEAASKTYLQEHPEAKLALAANAYERGVQKLRNHKRELVKADKSRTEVKKVEDQITKLMTQFNEAVQKAATTPPSQPSAPARAPMLQPG